MSEKSIERHVRIAGRPFTLRSRDVRRVTRDLEPEPIASHYVVVDTRRFPPKQVISAITGLDRADFTTHQARRTLMRLGFAAGRRNASHLMPAKPGSVDTALADRLAALVGRWVATQGDDVLHDASSPQELVEWLTQHGQKADSMFRVPEDELAATGLAPR
jgi:hypothetical protein